MTTYETIGNAFTTGVIIAIVIGSVVGLVIVVGLIIAIICVIKNMNRSNKVRSQGMILQSRQLYPQPWPNQYPPNTMSVANYPPTSTPYTISTPNYM